MLLTPRVCVHNRLAKNPGIAAFEEKMRYENYFSRLISSMILLLSVFYVLLPGTIFAQRPPTPPIDFNHLELDFARPGARSAAMGGAFIGAAQDETSVLYNPAGMTYVSRLTVSAHRRSYSRTNRVGGENFGNDQFTVGVVLPIKKVRFGYSRHQVFFWDSSTGVGQRLNIEPPLTTRQVIGGLGNFPGKIIRLSWRAFRDNWSLAYEISKKVSLGATLQSYGLEFVYVEKTFLDPQVMDGRPPRDLNAATHYATTDVHYLAQSTVAGSIGLMARLIPSTTRTLLAPGFLPQRVFRCFGHGRV